MFCKETTDSLDNSVSKSAFTLYVFEISMLGTVIVVVFDVVVPDNTKTSFS